MSSSPLVRTAMFSIHVPSGYSYSKRTRGSLCSSCTPLVGKVDEKGIYIATAQTQINARCILDNGKEDCYSGICTNKVLEKIIHTYMLLWSLHVHGSQWPGLIEVYLADWECSEDCAKSVGSEIPRTLYPVRLGFPTRGLKAINLGSASSTEESMVKDDALKIRPYELLIRMNKDFGTPWVPATKMRCAYLPPPNLNRGPLEAFSILQTLRPPSTLHQPSQDVVETQRGQYGCQHHPSRYTPSLRRRRRP